MEQGSKEWKEFRREHIGSSDAAVIMGLSPWKTPYKLWQQKMGGEEDFENEAMRRGKDLEPKARELFNETWGLIMYPDVVVCEDRPWQMASLDGVSYNEKVVLEIKCGGQGLYLQALEGIIPEYYKCQIQHQLAVTGFKKAFYCCYWGGEIHVLDVMRDDAFIEKMNEAEKAFWDCMQKKEPPALSDRDKCYELVENERGSELLKEYQSISEQEKELKERKDAIKEEIVTLGVGKDFILDGIKIYQTQSTSYDYTKMKQDGIELERYRKLSKPFWMVSFKGSRGERQPQ